VVGDDGDDSNGDDTSPELKSSMSKDLFRTAIIFSPNVLYFDDACHLVVRHNDNVNRPSDFSFLTSDGQTN